MRERRIIIPTENRPTSFAIRPDKKVLFHAAPNEGYVLHGRYVVGVQGLTSENHNPHGLPEEYHSIIVWRAVMMLHADDDFAPAYEFAARQYKELLGSLQRIYLPTVTVGGSLA